VREKLEGASPFGQTFGASTLRQHYLEQREVSQPAIEAADLWDRSLIYVATDCGREKARPSGASSWGTGHHLNNGSVLISPLLRRCVCSPPARKAARASRTLVAAAHPTPGQRPPYPRPGRMRPMPGRTGASEPRRGTRASVHTIAALLLGELLSGLAEAVWLIEDSWATRRERDADASGGT